jgi:hypothetical protein
MFVAICFFGKMGLMDTFMATSFERCVTAPLQNFFQCGNDHESINGFRFYLHTFFTGTCMQDIDVLRGHFPFLQVRVDDEKQHLGNKQRSKWKDLSSLDSCMHMVEEDENVAFVAFIRLDLLFTRPLSIHDIASVVEQQAVLSSSRCFTFGHKQTVLAHLRTLTTPLVEHETETQPPIKILKTTPVCVRVLADGSIHKHDRDVCPYVNEKTTPIC